MKLKTPLLFTFFILTLSLFSPKSHSQCFQIESILVDACGTQEGFNEMVRFKVGSTNLNTSNLSVVWATTTLNWQGLIKNSVTQSIVNTLNGDIIDAGGCGQLIEPVAGVLPANATVILVTSFNMDTNLNTFGALTEDTYIIFQNNPSESTGHFANSGSGNRTLSMSFNACSDTVTYNRALLINPSGATVPADGAIVLFDAAGTATYINNNCSAPVPPFTVNAIQSTVSACAGTTLALSGTAQGQITTNWSAANGTFSTPANLSTNYTIPANAAGTTIVITLTATNNCTLSITDTVNVIVTPSVVPSFNAITPICVGQPLAALPTTSTNGITGTWSPALNNLATTTYTFTPNAGQCATTTTLIISVNPANTVPAFTAVTPICAGQTLTTLPTTSTNGITGTWSPALNNLATTTYTFTPNAGQCATTATLIITVNTNTVPTFAAVAPICVGQALTALPTTSTNGIIGTWSPALNNLATTTYTFTPNTGQCATTTTLIISVNPANTVPTFTAVASICVGETLAALPTTSTNGITGTWSPALNNLATTTYTFTPNAGQCATTATLMISVNSATTVPVFTAVTPICAGQALTALPTTSTNGITGTWSPALNNLATTTYTFTPNAGQCATTVTLIITVNTNTVPAFTAVTPICVGQALTALPTTSTNGITGTWSPALNNLATTTYTFTPNAGQCATTATLIISVNPANTVPTFTVVPPICVGETLTALPTTSTNGITGIWSPVLNNSATTTYTFTPNAGQCATTATLIITITITTIPAFTAVTPICVGETLVALPTTSTNGVTGTWSPALNNLATTTYTFMPNAGQCATTTTLIISVNPATTVPSFTTVAPICVGETLAALPTTSINGVTGTWSPALNNSATTTYTFTPNAGQCATTTTLIISVNPATTVPAFTAVAPICVGETLAALPTTSTNGITGTWSPALNNSATTTYTFTPNAGQCATTATLIISVNPATAVPAFTTVAPICVGETLAALPATSTNGITGTWSPALNNLATTTYTFTPNAGQCATTATLIITVTNKIMPTFSIPSTFCVGSTPSDLELISDNGISGTWNPSTISTNGNYIFTPDTDQCALPFILTITRTEIDFEFTEMCKNGAFFIQASPLSNSFDPDNANFQWRKLSGSNIGTNEDTLNVTDVLNSTPEIEAFPLAYELTITTGNGCSKTKKIELFGAFCTIPKGISPNNDGNNDEWDLTSLGVKEVTVFNRYGTKVFNYKNYTNQWKGQSDKGDELPDATYFYVIDQGNGTNLTGWVYINRAY